MYDFKTRDGGEFGDPDPWRLKTFFKRQLIWPIVVEAFRHSGGH
ncbi:hypothetical protein CCACVL1_23229 [Corchorus capsularis]|uniref:Uncharacterized protein n=1 Tax=Corchorus capsularis TaxID=210143 RepID=A0A1R3GUY0_COCAP|nr:hypothetical protein CCACVL1_23229 [Corchorus capsularis]